VYIKDARARSRALAIRARLIGGFIVIARAAAIDDDSTKRNKALSSIYYATLRYVGAVKGNFNSSRTAESLRRFRSFTIDSSSASAVLRRSFAARYA